MGIVPIATFFLPYVNYTFKDSTFVLSAYQILTSPGIRFQGYLISIPLLSKIAVLCGAVLALTGGALLLLKSLDWREPALCFLQPPLSLC